jgi:adenylosuccinate synthase
MVKNVVVVGTQWGDEGKGKIVDWLTDRAGGVVRFQGGHNAGHTLVVGGKVYKLNLVPSGIVRTGVDCFIGNGVVLDIRHLLSEIAALEAGGIDVRARLKISPGCPLILPYHSALDQAREAAKGADSKIGTTGKGIGPTYEDKVARRALRVYDLFHPIRFADKLKENLDYHNFVLTRYLGSKAVDFDTVLAQAMADAEEIKPLVTDVSAALHALNALDPQQQATFKMLGMAPEHIPTVMTPKWQGRFNAVEGAVGRAGEALRKVPIGSVQSLLDKYSPTVKNFFSAGHVPHGDSSAFLRHLSGVVR